MDLYKLLPSFPMPPKQLITQALDNIRTGKAKVLMTDYFVYGSLVGRSGETILGSRYTRFSLPDQLDEWVHTNITPTTTSNIPAGIQIFYNTAAMFNYAPHVDGGRGKRVVNFMIDTGGENVDTVWYKENEQPLYRTYNHTSPRVNNITDYRSLTEVGKYRIPGLTWSVVETKIFHGIENMTRPRISLSIGITDADVDHFCNYHNIQPHETLWKAE